MSTVTKVPQNALSFPFSLYETTTMSDRWSPYKKKKLEDSLIWV